MAEKLLSELNGSQVSCVKMEPLEEIEVKEEPMEIKIKDIKGEYIEYDEGKDDNKVLLLEKIKQLELEKEKESEAATE